MPRGILKIESKIDKKLCHHGVHCLIRGDKEINKYYK